MGLHENLETTFAIQRDDELSHLTSQFDEKLPKINESNTVNPRLEVDL